MVIHIVMWKFKPEIEESQKEALKKDMEENLKGLVGKVPGLLTVEFIANPITNLLQSYVKITFLRSPGFPWGKP